MSFDTSKDARREILERIRRARRTDADAKAREQIQGKYLLVKQHDRVGRMADTAEYSEVAFPLERFDEALLEEIQKFAPSQVEFAQLPDGRTELILQHVYIERRMIPLNIYLQEALDMGNERGQARMERAVIEYGNAIKDLVAANIFPGDMLWKNFGITRNGKVINTAMESGFSNVGKARASVAMIGSFGSAR